MLCVCGKVALSNKTIYIYKLFLTRGRQICAECAFELLCALLKLYDMLFDAVLCIYYSRMMIFTYTSHMFLMHRYIVNVFISLSHVWRVAVAAVRSCNENEFFFSYFSDCLMMIYFTSYYVTYTSALSAICNELGNIFNVIAVCGRLKTSNACH